MSAIELASRLRRLGVTLWVEENSLRYRAPQGIMTAELRAEVAASKAELLELLDNAARAPKPAAILPVPRYGTAPLSFAQERVWFTEQLEPGRALFTIDAAVRLRFALDRAALQLAFDEMVRRHESLRTTFRDTSDGPVQVIAPTLRIAVGYEDLRMLPVAEREPRARTMAEEQTRRPFDLSVGPLVRVHLAQLGAADYLLILTIHHIISDGWSMGVFWHELAALYEQFAGGRPADLPPLPIQYPDFAIWQRQQLNGDGLQAQLTYWRQQLGNAPVLELPTDHPRPATQRFHGRHAQFSVPASVVRQLAALAQRQGATPFIVYLAGFQAMLSRYCSQDDIVIGSYHANRNHVEVEGLIGFFVNTLVFRGDLSGDPTFAELVGRMREVALGAYANQDVPFARLVEELAPRRDPSRNPIFQVVFQLFNAPTIEQPREDAEPPLAIERGAAAFDLVLSLWQAGDGLGGDVEYDRDLFEADTITRMIGHLNRLLAAAAEDPQQRLSELPLLDDDERQRVLFGLNADVHPVDMGRGLVERFRAQAVQRPSEVAFRHGQREITYAELDRRMRSVLAALRSAGVVREDVVGVCVERSPEAVAAILGVVAAGAAWLPLDPSYPTARLRFMITDAGARMVLARGRRASEATRDTGTRVLDLDGLAEDVGRQDLGYATPAGSDLAYLIYTSGSTGTPKGVAVEHAQVLNRLEWMWRRFPFQPGEVGCQKTALSFVDSIWELFGPLLQGVPTAILDEETVRDPVLLVTELARHRVTRLWLVPGALRALLDAYDDVATRLPQLRFWVSTGEPISPELFERFCRAFPEATLHNCYGTSEFWDATWYDPGASGRPAPGHRVPIGRVISNMRAYVLDRHLQPVPFGVPGELYVGGLGLARGYRGRPELTAERFVADPFSDRSGARMYATGDRARLRADGELEYLGRLDAQLKVRGMRIEPAEVEDVLAQHPAVKECVVRLEPAGDVEMLVGYLEPRQNLTVSVEELRRYLRTRLPEPMIPGRFIVVDRLPRTPSGKVDRAAISVPAPQDASSADRIAPRTALEQLIAGVWATVLGVPEIGVTESFFDLGGHSLLGTQVVARLRAALDVELPLRRLFEAPTVADFAAAVREDPELGATLERRAELIVQLSELSDDRVAELLALPEDHDGSAAARLG
jgi:amino acid adenylation domain-containing protein